MPEPPPFDYRPADPELEWRDGVPYSRRFGDSYYSLDDGLAESRHVFIDGNRLKQRWQQARAAGNFSFSIGETGFGTGLNFLAAWQCWRDIAGDDDRLFYIATEAFPLTGTDIARALSCWPELEPLYRELISVLPPRINGHHRCTLDGGRITLDLCYGESTACLRECLDGPAQLLQHSDRRGIDAWFLDGFAPAVNPAHWQAELCGLIAQLSADAASCASFTAAGHVRRALNDAGFNVTRSPGFGRKRHMTTATLRAAEAGNEEALPWHRPPSAREAKTAIVIGAGLAGCSTAAALARRGLRVTVLESGEQAAGGGSGVPAAVLYTRLSPAPGLMNLFTLHSFLHALGHYQSMPRDGAPGVVQLMHTAQLLAHYAQLQAQIGDCDWLRFLDADAAGELIGMPVTHPALYFPSADSFRPDQICREYLLSDNIDLITQTNAISLTPLADGWRVGTQDGSTHSADIVVIANAFAANQFEQTRWLPLRPIRGQLSYIDRDSAAMLPALPVCHEGYVVDNGQALIAGASFIPNNAATALSRQEHESNISSLVSAMPALGSIKKLRVVDGFTGIRCASPDYLPQAGAVPDAAAFLSDYAALGFDAKTSITTEGNYLRGLYLNVAHGSRGLSSTPLCAELIAAQVNGEPRPLPATLCQALSPARFLIRGLKRKTYSGIRSLQNTTSSVSETGLERK